MPQLMAETVTVALNQAKAARSAGEVVWAALTDVCWWCGSELTCRPQYIAPAL